MERKNTVLIIDDDKEFASAVKTAFEAKGWETATAPTCEEGLQRLATFSPALIILDMMFGNKAEGILAARRLKGSKKFAAYSKIPLLMLSDLRTQADVAFPNPSKNAYFLPVDEFLHKPVKPDALLAKAEEIINAASK